MIDSAIARKVLETVDAGLVEGIGKPVPGQMCVEAAICYALGLPHGDAPSCVAPALRRLKIGLNDAAWSSNETRAQGLRRLALAALGSADSLDEPEFARRCARLAISTCVPQALRAAAEMLADDSERQQRLLDAAALCESEPTSKSALVALDAARFARAYYAAAAYAAFAADAAAAAAADAAAEAADAHLSDFAEGVVQILIDMGAPGRAFLHLTEVP